MSPTAANPRPFVHVLLATFQGATFLDEQLSSLASQRGVALRIWVADDGSYDNTLDLLRARRDLDITILDVPPVGGATRNFLRLLAHARDVVQPGEWVAFCDQDDIWLPDKLERSVALLLSCEPGVPAMCGSPSLIVDPDNQVIGHSPIFGRAPGFGNALVQCIAGGNTLVMNREALMLMTAGRPPDVPSHDWWCYQLITGSGGRFLYDERPGLRYRQHVSNLQGTNRGVKAAISRMLGLFDGHFRRWNARNIDALLDRETSLTPASRAQLQQYRLAASARWPWQRMQALRRSRVYRQSPLQTLALFVACFFRKI